MKTLILSTLLATFASATLAAAPADAPTGSKGVCKDGTYSTSAEKKGACRGHQGVKDWYGEEATAAPMSKVGTAKLAPQTAPPAVVPPVTAAPTKPAAKAAVTPTRAAAGGGSGQVWANEGTKVYHCSGDRYYGKTKTGEYMSEADAKAKGFRGARGKGCA